MIKPLFRSSSMDRVLWCNGSITLVPLVDDREGDEGYEGVMLHWMIADRLIRELGATPPDGGLPPPEVPAGYKLPSFSHWIVDWAVRHVREVIPDDWSLMVEVEMEHEFGRWRNRGHADVIGFSPDEKRSRGIDWKTGRDPVDPADNNEQVGSYIVLQKCEWPSLEECVFDIAQPRIDEDSGFERISTVTLEGDRLERAPAVLDQRVEQAMDNAMELNSGRKQCNYCPVGCQCEALRGDQKLMKVQLTPEAIAKVKRQPDDATLGDWIITMKTLERPTKDATELLHSRLDKVPSIEAGCGTTITRKLQGGSYSVPDPIKFFAAVRTILSKDEQIARAFKPSMTRIKDEIAEAMNVNKTGNAPVTAESIFDGHLRPLVEQDSKRVLIFQ